MDRPQRDRPLQTIFIERGYDDTLPLDAVLARSQRGEWYFRRLDLTEHQLSGLNFRGADFSYCHAPRSNWASAYLAGVRFCGASLVGADLRGAYLRGADLRSLDLRGTDLRGADLSQTDLRGTDFRGADIAGICWHHSRGDRTTHLPAGLTFETLAIADSTVTLSDGSSVPVVELRTGTGLLARLANVSAIALDGSDFI